MLCTAQGFDVCIEASGSSQGIRLAAALTRSLGTIVLKSTCSNRRRRQRPGLCRHRQRHRGAGADALWAPGEVWETLSTALHCFSLCLCDACLGLTVLSTLIVRAYRTTCVHTCSCSSAAERPSMLCSLPQVRALPAGAQGAAGCAGQAAGGRHGVRRIQRERRRRGHREGQDQRRLEGRHHDGQLSEGTRGRVRDFRLLVDMNGWQLRWDLSLRVNHSGK